MTSPNVTHVTPTRPALKETSRPNAMNPFHLPTHRKLPLSSTSRVQPGAARKGSCRGTLASKKTPYKHVPHCQKPAHLVARRNERERKRVQAVNSAFVRLRQHVPDEPRHKRLSKFKTLKVAIQYIHRLQDTIRSHDLKMAAGSQGCVPRRLHQRYPLDDNQHLLTDTPSLNPSHHASLIGFDPPGTGSGLHTEMHGVCSDRPSLCQPPRPSRDCQTWHQAGVNSSIRRTHQIGANGPRNIPEAGRFDQQTLHKGHLDAATWLSGLDALPPHHQTNSVTSASSLHSTGSGSHPATPDSVTSSPDSCNASWGIPVNGTEASLEESQTVRRQSLPQCLYLL